MNFQNILFTVTDRVAVIIMNRPEALNALDTDTLAELDAAFTEVEDNPAIKGVIITGAGKTFAAGADIKQMAEYTPEQGRAYISMGQRIFNRLEVIEKPFLAAVNGYALGGGNELCMACDIRYASEKAIFGLPETNFGIIPGFGGSQRLPRIVSPGIARELIYSGRNIDAAEALRIGLVNRVCAPDKLLDEAMEVMLDIATKPAHSIRYAKISITRGMDSDLYKAIELEKDLVSLCFAQEDQKEGMRAFLEKRPPKFRS